MESRDMPKARPLGKYKLRHAIIAGTILTIGGLVAAAIIDMTLEDFYLAGTQVGDVSTESIFTSMDCVMCHGEFDVENDPHSTWAGSLMAQAGRDPLFYAQMTNANQDVANVGYFCMRCHVPMSFVTGHALEADGSTLDATDKDGVTCHFCHSMVDPIYKPGISPPEDEAILAALDDVPEFYGNSMFVLDPTGTRRGQYVETVAPHDTIYSPFHTTGEFCGTCHDVGNVAVTKQPDGTYRYNTIDERTPTEDLWQMFPLERTYTEWKLSEFANGGVDMGGRFGGDGDPVIETCQDCHMPKVTAQACFYGPEREDLSRHEFAGAAAQVLDLIAEQYRDDPLVDKSAIARARVAAVSMLERAATLETAQDSSILTTRVYNESGHKLPTGHIEGRRVWVNVQLKDDQGQILSEYGGYDLDTATLDEHSTTVYEMFVGLSEEAARITGLNAGHTGHMALADIIVKDNRIPPRGFNNEAFVEGGAPPVGETFEDGQYWHDTQFRIPIGATEAVVSVYYQNTPREYIEHLRDGNVTDHWGQTLYDLWETTGKGAPILMTTISQALSPSCPPDVNGDGLVNTQDFITFLNAYNSGDPLADFNLDGEQNIIDFLAFLNAYNVGCP